MPEKKYKLFYKIVVALTHFDVKRLEKFSKALHLKQVSKKTKKGKARFKKGSKEAKAYMKKIRNMR